MQLDLLEDIGLTKGEIRVYMALLELGTSTSGPIILRAKVARSKAYEILERLKEKGLVSEVFKERVRQFQALSPTRVLDYIKTKRKKLADQEEAFQKILPELLQKQGYSDEKEGAKAYVGIDSVQTFYSEMVDRLGNDEYLGTAFSPKALAHRSLLAKFHKFHKQRAHKGARAKILYCPGSIQYENLKTNQLYEYKSTALPVPTDLAIFKDTVATFTWSGTPRVFSIQAKANAERYREFFNVIWEQALRTY